MTGKNTSTTDRNVTLTRANGESATFGPMPLFEAVLVTVSAADKGVRAIVTPAGRS